MKKILFAFSTTLVLNLYANIDNLDILDKGFKVTLPWLDQKPKTYAKDFFIIQYLKQKDTSLEDAKKAYSMAHKSNKYVSKVFYKRFKSKIPPKNLKCYQASTKELLKEDSECIALGLSLKEATKVSKTDLHTFISKLDKYPTLKNDLKILASDDQVKALLDDGYKKFFKFFFKLGYDYRVKTFDKKFDEEFINILANQKDFEMFVRYSIYDKNKLQNLQKAFLNVKNHSKMTSNTLFLLGINAINHNDEEKAYYFFQNSYKKAYLKRDKDKALYWVYLVTDNKSFLHELSKSWDNNLYSLYAKELMNIPYDNIFYKVEQKEKETSYDIYDQFSWIKVLSDTKKNLDEKKLEKYKNLFSDEKTLPHYTFVLERYNKYKKQYFITPYKDILEDESIYKKVLIYSIARQESRFIPSSISVSTAQGVMQIMPFLSKSIAKELKDDYNIYEQFVPKVNIKYGSYHLDKLVKQFNNNPLFIAYAYNGGAGYTRSQFKKGLFKRIDKKYEPFLSMEMISYPETKKYGKKVLTNYYIYNNYLNKQNPLKLSTIFQTLVLP